MLLGDELTYADVVEALMPLEVDLQRTINPTLYTPAEFSARLADGNSFVCRVMEQALIMTKGNRDELGESGRHRTTES